MRRVWRWVRRDWRRWFAKRYRRRWLVAGAVLLVWWVGHLLTRPPPPPCHPENLCAIFMERPGWYRSSRRAFEAWGVPEAVQMAVIHHESGFRARARPPRRRFLWILPGRRLSTAYGYAQVLDLTWRQYQRQAERPDARRDDFDDVTHFVAWYGRELHRLTGIPRDDTFRLYLAYHEGPNGYLEGRHRGKPWLLAVARQVDARASRYQRQLDGCRDQLHGPLPWWWLLLALLLATAVALAWRRWRTWPWRRRPWRRRPRRQRRARRRRRPRS